MNIGRTICLVVTLAAAGSLHAQNCSGGPDGGTDATGNQCSTPTDVAANTTGSGVAPSAQSSTTGGVQQLAPAAPLAVRSAPMLDEVSKPAVTVAPVSRAEGGMVAAMAPASISRIEVASASQCSGGPDGGMDATGNQCNEAADAVEIRHLALIGRRQ
jgi:hypothetical protein